MFRDSGRECESSCSGSPATSPYLSPASSSSSSSSSSFSCSPALPQGAQDFSLPFVPTLTAVASSPDLRWMVQPSVITSAARPPGPPMGYAHHQPHHYQQQQLQRLGGAAPTQRALQGVPSRPGVIRIVASAPTRRKRPAEELNPEEDEKRRVRRERNKQAAAKCRHRRRELTDTLQAEADKLEEERSALQSDIRLLQKEREDLERILSAHRALCRLPPNAAEPDSSPTPAGDPQDLLEEQRQQERRRRGDAPRGPDPTPLVAVKLEPTELADEVARNRASRLSSPEHPGGESHSCATSYRRGSAGGGQGSLRSAGRGEATAGALGSRTLMAL
ncbi:uncharacterized protein LOC116947250 [Petromyzon marinus]|uniref:uncharacterized protein LOC116947250 n=1 Tax=Petromyzon marinus TaxID=7757 RepID=UPI003F713AE7